MQCDDFEQRLNWLWDERRNPQEDDSLHEHARVCAACQSLLAGQGRLQTLLAVPVTACRADFAKRTVALAAAVAPAPSAPAVQRSPRSRLFLPLLAAAAMLFLLVVPAIYRSPRPGLGQAAQNGKRTGLRRQGLLRNGTIAALQPPQARRPLPAPPSLEDVAQSANSADLDRPVDLDRPGEPLSSDPEELRRVWRDIWQSLPTIPDEHREPINCIAGGFLPITSTISAAFDALRRTLPAPRDDAPVNPQAVRPGFSTSALLG